MRFRYFEDRIDEAMIAVLRFCAAHIWEVADRVFKVLAWLIALSILWATYDRTQSRDVAILATALAVIWLGAVIGEFYKVLGRTADRIGEAFNIEGRSGWTVVLRLGLVVMFSAAVLAVFFKLILPVVWKAALAILGAVGKA